MKKFKIGETYRVGSDGAEKGNIIRILGVCGTPGGGTDYLYETIQGKWPRQSRFDYDSAFAKCLEPVKKPERKIVITTDGKTTTAKLYDGRKTIREAKAVCSDSDTFDFNLGAGIALARLTGRPFLGVNLSQPEYNPDDVRLPKPKTLRDVVAERDPDKIDPDEAGGVKGCPHHYDCLRDVKYTHCFDCFSCEECWSQPYTPKEEAKQERESLVSPELKQLLTDAIKDAYINAVSEGIIAKLREIGNEKTGGNNHE